MNDYFDRLAGKNLGSLPLAQPVLAPSFAPSPLLDAALPLEPFEALEGETPEIPAAPQPGRRAYRAPEEAGPPAVVPSAGDRIPPQPVNPARQNLTQAAPPEPDRTPPAAPALVPSPQPHARILVEEPTPDAPQAQADNPSGNPPARPAPVRAVDMSEAGQPPAPDLPERSAPLRPQRIDPSSRLPQPEPQAQPALVQSANARRIAEALEPAQPGPSAASLADAEPQAATAGQPPEAAPPQTVVKITIGRIDVRASAPPPAAPPAASPGARPAPAVTLEQYLKARSEERS